METSIPNNQGSNDKHKQESSTERLIYQNRELYIKLAENESKENTLDATCKIKELAKSLKLGEMIYAKDFSLFNSMNSLEIGHPKMDLHFEYQNAITYKKAITNKLVKEYKSLDNNDILNLVDHLFIKEVQWLKGASPIQTLFSFIYFSDSNLQSNLQENQLLAVFLNSIKYLVHLYYDVLKDCNALRDEDYYSIPLQNLNKYSNEKLINDLRLFENKLRNEVKELSNDDPQRKIISGLILRLKYRRNFLKIIKDIFNLENKERYSEFIVNVNSLKEIVLDYKTNLINFDLSYEKYFSENLPKLLPTISSNKKINNITCIEAISNIEQLLEQFTEICRIFELKDFFQLQRSLEDFNYNKPFVICRAILELNLFPKNSKLLFGKIDYTGIVKEMLKDLKINFIEETSEIMNNFIAICKELLLKNLKNRSRQIREIASLFEALAFLLIESNKVEKENNKNTKKNILTNLLLKHIFYEMLQYMWIHLHYDLFAYYELDYFFYCLDSILNSLSRSNISVASKFAEKILKEGEDFVKSTAKKKLSLSQKMMLDEIHIYNAMKYAVKAIALICRYLKKANLLRSSESKELNENEKMRIENRFAFFKNLSFCIDLSYDRFIEDSDFELSEKDGVFATADNLLKQSMKLLTELKGTDQKLRDCFHYSNEYLDNLSKAVASNTVFVFRAKNLKTPSKIVINLKKFNTVFPILEIK